MHLLQGGYQNFEEKIRTNPYILMSGPYKKIKKNPYI